MMAEDLQAMREDAVLLRWTVDGDTTATERERGLVEKYEITAVNLCNEVERLTTENTFHSTQLDMAREEIQKLRAFVEWIGYDAPPRWADKAKNVSQQPEELHLFHK